MPNARVRDGWVQNARERLYSLKKEKSEVDSRGKNFKAIGVPGGSEGTLVFVVFLIWAHCSRKTFVCFLTSFLVYGQHDLPIGAFSQQLQEPEVLWGVQSCQRLSAQVTHLIQEPRGRLDRSRKMLVLHLTVKHFQFLGYRTCFIRLAQKIMTFAMGKIKLKRIIPQKFYYSKSNIGNFDGKLFILQGSRNSPAWLNPGSTIVKCFLSFCVYVFLI